VESVEVHHPLEAAERELRELARADGDATEGEDEIYQLLCAHDVALCLSDHHDAPSPWEVTARHVYLRGHGPEGRYKDHYPDRILRTWARHISKWRRERRTVFVYFDNDQKSAAPTDARRLFEILQQARR
jgi:uncharacterized protein YecE (DUF72 family)